MSFAVVEILGDGSVAGAPVARGEAEDAATSKRVAPTINNTPHWFAFSLFERSQIRSIKIYYDLKFHRRRLYTRRNGAERLACESGVSFIVRHRH